MMMSPLNVRTTMVALPSPKVARMEWLLSGPRRFRGESFRCAAGPPMVSGSSERIDPLKLFAFSSKPAGFASSSRMVPECALI